MVKPAATNGSSEGKSCGQFYTPRQISDAVDTTPAPYLECVYEPCGGSGGMVAQTLEVVQAGGGELGDG